MTTLQETEEFSFSNLLKDDKFKLGFSLGGAVTIVAVWAIWAYQNRNPKD